MMDRIGRALQIAGWMEPPELEWLERSSSGLRLVVEFGSWCGRSSVAMTAAKRLVCVDTWQGSEGEPNDQYVLVPDALDQFRRNLASEMDAGAVETRVGDLGNIQFQERLVHEFAGLADMVFIDSAHDEASVRRDIALARRLLRPGGLLCGHDYSESWPGVKSAVDDLVPDASSGPCSIWWCR